MPSNSSTASSPHPQAAGRGRAAYRCSALALALTGLGACKSAEQYASEADEQVFALVEERRGELFGERGEFRIEPPPDSLRQRMLRGEVGDAQDLSILDCLGIASESNRDLQSRRESLYLTALDVTLERWRLGWIDSAGANAAVSGSGGQGELASARAGYGLDRVLGTGARIVSDIGLGLVRFIGNGGGWEVMSDIGLSVTQPLLRGAGARIVREPLTQAERNLVYEVRSFERFRRTLAVDIAQRVYRVVQQIDIVANQRTNTENLTELRRRNEALAQAGRLSDIQADQASQDELRSANRLLIEEARYEQLLDDFKFFLGLPIEAAISLSDSTFDELQAAGVEAITYEEELAVSVALRNRLDYLTALDRVDDAIRRVEVAADGLRAGLGVSAAAFAPSDPEDPFSYKFDDIQWRLSLELDLPVNRLPERNVYRRSLITLQSATRDAGELADRIRIQLKQDLRLAQTTLESYQIQVASEALAARRVESTRLNLEAGRAATRDILEAQEALLNAQNATTTALVDHTLAKLALFTDMDILRVDESGMRVDYQALALIAAPPDA